MIALLILGLALALFVVFRKRKRSSSAHNTSRFFSFRNQSPSNANSNTVLMTFLLLHSLNAQEPSPQKAHILENKPSQQKSELQQTREEILALLQGVDL